MVKCSQCESNAKTVNYDEEKEIYTYTCIENHTWQSPLSCDGYFRKNNPWHIEGTEIWCTGTYIGRIDSPWCSIVEREMIAQQLVDFHNKDLENDND